MVDEPEHRARDRRVAADSTRPFIDPSPMTKAALNLLGHDVGGLRLPLVEADERRDRRADPRALLERHGLLRRRFERGTLRVLPLGGLGEIGKNMTVLEYDGRIVVVDTGLRSRRPSRSASTSCCRTSPTCASAPTTSRRSC